jgi:proteasome accessory factor B
VDRTERLLNLVVCLMAARYPVSRERIVASVPGYSDAPSPAALERMFERDKDELRSLGIPIETMTDASGDVEGYQIPLDRYAMPPMAFSAEERAVLLIAAAVWQQAALGPLALQAVLKIQTIDPGPAALLDAVPDARLDAADAAFLVLLRAIRQRRKIRFDYRAASAQAVTRRDVDPWGLVTLDGAWYLVGYDHEREAPRVFRVSRMTGPVQVTAQEQRHPMPADEDLARRVRMEPESDEGIIARVRVRAGAGARLRELAGDREPFVDAELLVPGSSLDHLAAEVCAAGAAAEVLEPVELRIRVQDQLESILNRHMATP